jgi:hypothetical protein
VKSKGSRSNPPHRHRLQSQKNTQYRATDRIKLEPMERRAIEASAQQGTTPKMLSISKNEAKPPSSTTRAQVS